MHRYTFSTSFEKAIYWGFTGKTHSTYAARNGQAKDVAARKIREKTDERDA